jgi:hypothetical protein
LNHPRKQAKLLHNFGTQDTDKKNQDWSRYEMVDWTDLLQNRVQLCPILKLRILQKAETFLES